MTEHTPGPADAASFGLSHLTAIREVMGDDEDGQGFSDEDRAEMDAAISLLAAAPETAAERNQLREVNAELVETLYTAGFRQDDDGAWHAPAVNADLLAALHKYVEWCSADITRQKYGNPVQLRQLILNDARAAIAKATLPCEAPLGAKQG